MINKQNEERSSCSLFKFKNSRDMKHVNARQNVHVRRRGKKRSVKPDFILVSDCLCVTGNAIGPGMA